MKKIAALGVLLAALAASPAHAQGALFLNWDDCSYGGTLVKSFACNQNLGAPFVLYPTVVVPQSMTGFVGVGIEIGIALDSETTPPWWQTRAGECRPNALHVSFDLLYNYSTCAEIWQGRQAATALEIRNPSHAPFRLCLIGDGQLAEGSPLSVPATGEELYLCRIAIFRVKSVGAGSCEGCATGATFVFERCTLRQAGTLGDFVLGDTYQPGRAYPTFNGGLPVPAVNRTWGTVKNLYR